IPLYNHQIPPGAGEVVHFKLDVPADVSEPIRVDLALRYRKFDTTYVKYFQGDDFKGNDLPVMTLATDSVTFPVARVADDGASTDPSPARIPEWERWNDYGIGLLRKSQTDAHRGELRQAEDAFARVEALGRADGPLNLARAYLQEGRLDEAVEALQ